MIFPERESTIGPIMENDKRKSIKDLPFEERAFMFKNLVHAIGISVGGDEEYVLRNYGQLTTEFHELTSLEEREKFKTEKMDPIFKKLGEAGKTNPKVGEAVVNIITAEMAYF